MRDVTAAKVTLGKMKGSQPSAIVDSFKPDVGVAEAMDAIVIFSAASTMKISAPIGTIGPHFPLSLSPLRDEERS